MNKYTRKCCKKYINQIKKELYCSYNLKKAFINDFKLKIDELVESYPAITIDEIISELGSPQSIAESFHMYNIDELKLKAQSLSKRQLILAGLLALAILSAIVILYSLGGHITINN